MTQLYIDVGYRLAEKSWKTWKVSGFSSGILSRWLCCQAVDSSREDTDWSGHFCLKVEVLFPEHVGFPIYIIWNGHVLFTKDRACWNHKRKDTNVETSLFFDEDRILLRRELELCIQEGKLLWRGGFFKSKWALKQTKKRYVFKKSQCAEYLVLSSCKNPATTSKETIKTSV